VAAALFGDGDPFAVVTRTKCDTTKCDTTKHRNHGTFTCPGATSIDHHRSFLVRYDAANETRTRNDANNANVDLAYHYDDAEVTLNVNLGGAFEGGELLFGGSGEDERAEAHVRDRTRDLTPVTHREGVGILHRGAHCHEATPVASGTRVNLIAWCRSAAARKRRCAMCFRARVA